jgi:hypothetical protein
MTPEDAHGIGRTIDRRMALAREWDDLAEQVRALEGFHDFLRLPELGSLLRAAEGGPVIIVNVSRWRCDALIVEPSGFTPCALPGLTAQDAAEQADRYLRTLQKAEQARDERDTARQRLRRSGAVADRQSAQSAERALRAADAATENMLTDVLGWLWRVVAEPVLNALGLHRTPSDEDDWPRLWWCPTGPLTLLPLHAAGHHAPSSAAPGQAVIDRVVSSYTPTLRALTEARKPLDQPPAEADKLLVVALTDTPGERPLPAAADEQHLLAELLPEQHRTVLEGAAATRPAVRDALKHHRWVHFSCHGNQDLDDPSRGGLALQDGMLTIADIAAEHYHAEFAGLFACKTATGGANLLDEAITLAAALHYTGYRHVIGTLWSVYDSAATTDLIGSVYRRMTFEGRLHPELSAHALHMATRSLRGGHPDRPSMWTPFTHTGP